MAILAQSQTGEQVSHAYNVCEHEYQELCLAVLWFWDEILLAARCAQLVKFGHVAV